MLHPPAQLPIVASPAWFPQGAGAMCHAAGMSAYWYAWQRARFLAAAAAQPNFDAKSGPQSGLKRAPYIAAPFDPSCN